MSKLTTRRLLRRHAIPFVVSLASLTVLLLANLALQRVPQLSAGGEPASLIVEVLVFSVPHTLALTIPMAVLLTVLWVFAGLGKEGVIASARRERHGVRRLVAPVLGAAAVIGGGGEPRLALARFAPEHGRGPVTVSPGRKPRGNRAGARARRADES